MRLTLVAATGLTAFGISAAACKPATSDIEREAIARAVEETWADMMRGAQALDADRIRAGYAAKPVVALNGRIIDDFDRDQFAATRRWLKSLRQFHARYDNVHLEVLGSDAAVATMNHHLSWTDTTGLAGEWHSAWTAVFRRLDGRWRIVYSHESVPPPDN
jgi:ketosteroid isomerase-like protein